MKIHRLKVAEATGTYILENPETELTEDEILKMANQIVRKRMKVGQKMTSPDMVRRYLQAELQGKDREHFGIIIGNTKHAIIHKEIMFTGTIDSASVWPREVVKLVLEHKGAVVWLYHNHPGGSSTPSMADRQITRRLSDALALIDVKVHDHFIVSNNDTMSFAERGMM